MNAIQYAYLLNNPAVVNTLHAAILDKITIQFPFFQSLRAIQLKNLYVQDSFHYNQSLRETAAYTTDRSVLFEFVTSENFMSIQKEFLDEKEAKIRAIVVNDSELVTDEKFQETIPKTENVDVDIDDAAPYQSEKRENSIRNLIVENEIELYKEIAHDTTSNSAEKFDSELETRLEIGKPLSFSPDEKHSFQEWLQLASFKPIDRNESAAEKPQDIPKVDEIKQKKIDIIDRFIASNPKISSVKNYVQSVSSTIENDDTSSIMTETLAKVYLEQKKYQKAIQAYEILILKYPEKFSFFANRISDIKSLQQNNH